MKLLSATQEQLCAIAWRAVEHHKAKTATRAAKRVYHDAWRCYECGMGTFDPDADYSFTVHDEDRISAHHPEFDAAKDATKQWYEAYQKAKRAEYNARRRLETAIRATA